MMHNECTKEDDEDQQAAAEGDGSKLVDYSGFKPNYKQAMRDFIQYFHETFMMPFEHGLNQTQRELFEVGWSNCREKLGADIEGSMTKSILESHKTITQDPN